MSNDETEPAEESREYRDDVAESIDPEDVVDEIRMNLEAFQIDIEDNHPDGGPNLGYARGDLIGILEAVQGALNQLPHPGGEEKPSLTHEQRDQIDSSNGFEQFRKRPVPVAARQRDEPFHLDTPEGTMRGKAGDYEVIGVEGERYPVDRQIFEQTYEAVENPHVPDEYRERVTGDGS